MSNVSKRRKEGSKTKIKGMGDHKEFLKRITKTLYYGKLPSLACLSLPVTEISCEVWSLGQRGRSLKRLHCDAAAEIARSACVSPCALVLALLYLERLNACNPDYVASAAPADLFLVSLMVGNKFLQDDGEDDDVLCSEWATSGNVDLHYLKKLELEFLNAIDWNVYVSDESFEAGLARLERRVALRQARLRGFFTYADLAAAGAPPCLADLLHGAAAALALTLAGLAAVLSALAVSTAWLPAPHHAAARTAPRAPLPTNATDLPCTADAAPEASPLDFAERSLDESLARCGKWPRQRRAADPAEGWRDALAAPERRPPEPWWSTAAVFNRVYRSSPVDCVRWWLKKVNLYADLLVRGSSEPSPGACGPPRCVRAWLSPGQLGALVAAVSDR